MLTKVIKLLMIALAISFTTSAPVAAGGLSTTGVSYTMSGTAFDVIDGVTDLEKLSAKLGEPYDESKDPALHKSSPPEEGPQHGYFAVSIVMLIAVGMFIYFLKMD